MAREFTKNMFIMLVAIMLGVFVITYFAADIIRRSEVETLTTKIESITTEKEIAEARNINFTNHFMKSSVLLDAAREDRAYGDYHFDLALLFYNTALSGKNSSTIESYQARTINNCTNAMEKYLISHENFISAKGFFNDTKAYTSYEKYREILDLYIGLTGSGAKLTMLRYNASKYLRYMAENLTKIGGLTNISNLLNMFNQTMDLYEEESGVYDGYKEQIDEYEFFDEMR